MATRQKVVKARALPPMQMVVLMDESGSLITADARAEQEAAKTIAFSTLAEGSGMSVVEFASAEAVAARRRRLAPDDHGAVGHQRPQFIRHQPPRRIFNHKT